MFLRSIVSPLLKKFIAASVAAIRTFNKKSLVNTKPRLIFVASITIKTFQL